MRAYHLTMGPAEISGWLRQWPRGLDLDLRAIVRQSLKACREIFEAPRALMAWEEAKSRG